MSSNEIVATKSTTSERLYSNTGGSSSQTGPALVSHAGRLWLAWAGTDRRINIMSSADGVRFDQKFTLDERTGVQPSLAVHGGRLVVAWAGGGDRINVATLNA
jgi:hypothetical protein